MHPIPLLLALFAGHVHAEWPAGPWPECGPEQLDACPNDFGGRWYLRSWTERAGQLDDPAEAALGSGIGADHAWQRSAGRPEVLIAVLDSGIEWDSWHVRRKPWLQRAELPLPEGAIPPGDDPYDLDGDGLLTVDDYEFDPRVAPDMGQDAADHHLDASDLIAAFSDGIDDDGNGYVDDIAGWDFHWNDNDPSDDTRFGHGTFEAELSLAEAGDGGDIGVCPGCSFLPVRVGDAFIADSDNIASAILFAADSGADVIQAALGSLGNNAHLQEAMRYAASRGVVMVMAAGDETSYHPNAPGVNADALYVKAVRYDTSNEDDATTYINVSNCTNYGPRLDLSAPSTGCASGATGVTSGVAGLVFSAGLDAGITPPLQAAEVRQILTATATDIDVALSRGPQADPDRYPSHPGWEMHFGHGRVSAAAAVDAVWSGAIPPVAEFEAPLWFEVWPTSRGTVPIRGRVQASRSPTVSWSVGWALGADPRDDAFTELASGTGALDGALAELPLSTLIEAGLLPGGPWSRRTAGETTVERALAAHADGVTLRLLATDAEGQVGQARRLFFVEDDPDALPGFPLSLGSSIEASPRAVDLDGDGLLDLLVATSAGDVHAINPRTGDELPGWPVRTAIISEQDSSDPGNHTGAPSAAAVAAIPSPREGIVATPAVADLDGDGVLDVVVATMRGRVYAWTQDGELRNGFPVSVDPALSPTETRHVKVERGFLGSPALADLDGDGPLEIVAPAMDGYVYVWQQDGTPKPGWPVPIVSLGPAANPFNRVVSSPAIGDLDGDGILDVVVGSNESAGTQYALLFAIHGDGLAHDGPAYLPGFPVHVFAGYVEILPVVGEGMPTSPALADVDGDGIPEIGANAIADPGALWSSTGEEFTNLNSSQQGFGDANNSDEPGMLQAMNSGTWADLDGDAVPEWINGGIGLRFASGIAADGQRSEFDHLVAAWDALTGDMKEGYPQVMEDIQFFMNPAVADLTNDGLPEVISASGGYLVHAWDVFGREADGFPKSARGWVVASPVVADLDGNGLLDVAVATRSGMLFAWGTAGVAWGDVQWPTFHHDNAGTGNLATPLPVVLPPVGVPEDCTCTHGPAPGGLLAAPFFSFLLWRRRP